MLVFLVDGLRYFSDHFGRGLSMGIDFKMGSSLHFQYVCGEICKFLIIDSISVGLFGLLDLDLIVFTDSSPYPHQGILIITLHLFYLLI